MAVLVTGGAGYVGSHMVWRLLDVGEDVVVLDRLSTGFEWAVPKEAKLVVGDADIVTRRSASMASKRSSTLPVRSLCPNSVSGPLGYYLNNTCKTRTLLQACVDSNVPRFIFSSTAAVTGRRKRFQFPKMRRCGRNRPMACRS